MAIYLKVQVSDEMTGWQEISIEGSRKLDINDMEIDSLGDIYIYDYENREEEMEELTAREISKKYRCGEIGGSTVWSKQEPNKYYLRDSFLLDDGTNYLNYKGDTNSFVMNTKQSYISHKTQFTDKDIEELEIPIERFEKIEVEED